MLTQIFGATSYEDLCMINGNLYDTYEDAVRQLGLLDENDEFDKCLKEAATYKFPSRLRQLFASILLFGNPKEFNAYKLFRDNVMDLGEDYFHDLSDDDSDEEYEIAISKILLDIEKYLIPYEKTLKNYGFPEINPLLLEKEFQRSNLILEETNYDPEELNDLLLKENLLNADQKIIYDSTIKLLNKSY